MNKLKERSRAALARTKHEEGEEMRGKPPFALRIRSSTWWIALCVGFGGTFTLTLFLSLSERIQLMRNGESDSKVLVDLSSYSIVVPVIPFRLEALGYTDIGSKTGWLVAAYAGGLIVSSPPVGYIGAKYKGRQIPLVVGLLFMAGAIIMFMEAKTYALMVVARILQYVSL